MGVLSPMSKRSYIGNKHLRPIGQRNMRQTQMSQSSSPSRSLTKYNGTNNNYQNGRNLVPYTHQILNIGVHSRGTPLRYVALIRAEPHHRCQCADVASMTYFGVMHPLGDQPQRTPQPRWQRVQTRGEACLLHLRNLEITSPRPYMLGMQ